MNALKHGGASSAPLLPGESAEERAMVVGELVGDLAPTNAEERELAGHIADLSWQARRLQRAEERLFAEAAAADPSLGYGEILADQFTRPRLGPIVRLINHDCRLQGAINAALRRFVRLQSDRTRLPRFRKERPTAAQNEPISQPLAPVPLLTAARRAELSPVPQAVQNEPTAHGRPVAQNEPISAMPMRRAAAQNKPILPRGAVPDRRPLVLAPVIAKGAALKHSGRAALARAASKALRSVLPVDPFRAASGALPRSFSGLACEAGSAKCVAE